MNLNTQMKISDTLRDDESESSNLSHQSKRKIYKGYTFMFKFNENNVPLILIGPHCK